MLGYLDTIVDESGEGADDANLGALRGEPDAVLYLWSGARLSATFGGVASFEAGDTITIYSRGPFPEVFEVHMAANRDCSSASMLAHRTDAGSTHFAPIPHR